MTSKILSVTPSVNPFMPVAPGKDLENLDDTFYTRSFYGNHLKKRNDSQKEIHNSSSNILLINAEFKDLLQMYIDSDGPCQGELQAGMG